MCRVFITAALVVTALCELAWGHPIRNELLTPTPIHKRNVFPVTPKFLAKKVQNDVMMVPGLDKFTAPVARIAVPTETPNDNGRISIVLSVLSENMRNEITPTQSLQNKDKSLVNEKARKLLTKIAQIVDNVSDFTQNTAPTSSAPVSLLPNSLLPTSSAPVLLADESLLGSDSVSLVQFSATSQTLNIFTAMSASLSSSVVDSALSIGEVQQPIPASSSAIPVIPETDELNHLDLLASTTLSLTGSTLTSEQSSPSSSLSLISSALSLTLSSSQSPLSQISTSESVSQSSPLSASSLSPISLLSSSSSLEPLILSSTSSSILETSELLKSTSTAPNLSETSQSASNTASDSTMNAEDPISTSTKPLIISSSESKLTNSTSALENTSTLSVIPQESISSNTFATSTQATTLELATSVSTEQNGEALPKSTTSTPNVIKDILNLPFFTSRANSMVLKSSLSSDNQSPPITTMQSHSTTNGIVRETPTPPSTHTALPVKITSVVPVSNEPSTLQESIKIQTTIPVDSLLESFLDIERKQSASFSVPATPLPGFTLSAVAQVFAIPGPKITTLTYITAYHPATSLAPLQPMMPVLDQVGYLGTLRASSTQSSPSQSIIIPALSTESRITKSKFAGFGTKRTPLTTIATTVTVTPELMPAPAQAPTPATASTPATTSTPAQASIPVTASTSKAEPSANGQQFKQTTVIQSLAPDSLLEPTVSRLTTLSTPSKQLTLAWTPVRTPEQPFIQIVLPKQNLMNKLLTKTSNAYQSTTPSV